MSYSRGPLEANIGVRNPIRVVQKVPEGDGRQTHRQTDKPVGDMVCSLV